MITCIIMTSTFIRKEFWFVSVSLGFFTVDYIYNEIPPMVDLMGWTIIKNLGVSESKPDTKFCGRNYICQGRDRGWGKVCRSIKCCGPQGRSGAAFTSDQDMDVLGKWAKNLTPHPIGIYRNKTCKSFIPGLKGSPYIIILLMIIPWDFPKRIIASGLNSPAR